MEIHMESVSEWRELPQDILLLILKSLNAQFYHLLLRAVCSFWRSALPLSLTSSDSRRYCHNDGVPLKIPYLISQNINPTDEQLLPLYGNIVETIFFHVSPVQKDPNLASSITDSWIIQAEEVGPAKWALFNPLSGNKLILTPDMVALGYCSINLLDYRITELWRSHSLRWVDEVYPPPDLDSRPIRKVICSFNESNYLVLLMALCNNGKLAFYQPRSKEWSFSDVIWEGEFLGFSDIISYNGRFCAIDLMDRLLRIDPLKWMDRDRPSDPDLLCDNIERGHPCYIDYNQNYLVLSKGSMYLVLVVRQSDSYLREEYSFKVYELRDDRLDDAQWVEVTSIGDHQVLFTGGESSFACSSSLLQWDNNIRILFRTIASSNAYNGWYYDEFQNIHALNDNPIEPCNLDCKSLSRLFWPTPSWVLLDMDQDAMFYSMFGSDDGML